MYRRDLTLNNQQVLTCQGLIYQPFYARVVVYVRVSSIDLFKNSNIRIRKGHVQKKKTI